MSSAAEDVEQTDRANGGIETVQPLENWHFLS